MIVIHLFEQYLNVTNEFVILIRYLMANNHVWIDKKQYSGIIKN